MMNFTLLLVVLSLVFLLPLSNSYLPNGFLGESHDGSPLRVLLLTAHPDDECMFFAPTLLGLLGQQRSRVASDKRNDYELYSLCLSSGDSEGLGETRKRELARSLDVLGIPDGRRWVLDEPFKDNITLYWDEHLIAEHLKPYVEKNKIDAILTFDDQGISSHPNHISLQRGAAVLKNALTHPPRIFTLKTVDIVPKYTGAIGAVLKKSELALCSIHDHVTALGIASPILGLSVSLVSSGRCAALRERSVLASISQYVEALIAMLQHESQLVWFRWLYVTWSRYMWVNEWTEV